MTGYADVADQYAAAGWPGVLPLPPRRKTPPPTGYTGAGGDPTPAQIDQWAATRPAGSNVALRMPDGVIGIDVDAYGDKQGAATLAAIEAEHGPLPATWLTTSRTDGVSGIRLYRVPAGVRLVGDAGPGIEIVQRHHRYAVVWPSVHPDTGQTYRWQWTGVGDSETDVPTVDDLPDLPATWVEALTERRHEPGATGTQARELQDPDGYVRVTATRTELPGSWMDAVQADYNARTDWPGVLEPHGWTHHHTTRNVAHWRHPNATAEWSATVGATDTPERLCVHSPNTPFDTQPATYDRFGAYAVLDHHGDRLAAARALRDRGYGPPPPPAASGATAPAQPAETDDASSWQFLDLGPTLAAIAAGEIVRPTPTVGRFRDTDNGVFYPGRINSVFGESGDGKSWLALLFVAQEIRAGHHVMFFDYEDKPDGILSRLLALGLPPDRLARQFHYAWPDSPLGTDEIPNLVACVDKWNPTLAIIDSTGESMAVEGVKPNDDDAVARWFRLLPNILSRRGASVIIVDHVVKDKETRGLFAIGSQRKRAAINGHAVLLETVCPMGKHMNGRSKLVCSKDRNGTYHRGQHVADFHLDDDPGPTDAYLTAPDPAAVVEPFRPTGIMESLSRALEALTGAVAQRTAIDLPGVKGKREHRLTALARLAEEGYVDARPGSGKSVLYESVKPFRDVEELVA